MKLKPCPCCRGQAIFADMVVGKSSRRVRMWQVSCSGCGLSTDLDEKKTYAAQRWNLRQEYANLKMWVTLLAALLPASIIISLLLGNLMGISLIS
ncbi:Lar family restriction alleviation protein [Endozoicomonas sp.]|uniref:Lar family restriction alleviation protein n=1 Tax=Endozoicomonas sp. TaxID=1892382 RepID=UPI00383B5144